MNQTDLEGEMIHNNRCVSGSGTNTTSDNMYVYVYSSRENRNVYMISHALIIQWFKIEYIIIYYNRVQAFSKEEMHQKRGKLWGSAFFYFTRHTPQMRAAPNSRNYAIEIPTFGGFTDGMQ